MTLQQAAIAWQQRQTALLAAAYQQAWKQGQHNFYAQHPAQRAQAATPTTVPVKPARAQMSRALAPALLSLARMAAQLATILPSVTGAATLNAAATAYLRANTWRLAGAVSILWAAEQAGYAQAAHAHGMLIAWQLEPRAEHCDTCPALAALPPMPFDQWPTLPGEGLTDCRTGCKCSMRAVPAPGLTPAMPPLTPVQHELLTHVGNRQPVLVAA